MKIGGRTLGVAASFAAIAILEEVRPLRPRVEKKTRHVFRDMAMAALSGLVTAVVDELLVAPVARQVTKRRLGLLQRMRLPRPVRIVAAVLLLDYTLWVWHWLNHKASTLWRFHRVHHVDLDLDSWTALRFHFGEMAIAGVVRMLQMRLIGAEPEAVRIWQTLLLPSIFFHHSKIALPWQFEKTLSLLIVTPRMHTIHHSTVFEETDSNWSSLFSVWDRVHGTFRLDVPQESITIGVPAYQSPSDVTIGKVIVLPVKGTAGDWGGRGGAFSFSIGTPLAGSPAAMPADLRGTLTELTGSRGDYDALLRLIGPARFVLIGEASHGTHEFYRIRAEITQRLIEEQGFNAVAVEADWPDAYRVNRYVRSLSDDGDAAEALGDFKRFPTWMWRNADIVDFVGWLRDYNDRIPEQRGKAGFYGVDLYSMFTSIEAVISYLDKVDPEAARRARQRYACFDHFGEDSQAYGYATAFGVTQPCEDEVVAQLIDFRRKAADYATRDGHIPPDEAFFAEQNARLVLNAERYYRSMFGGRASSWNLRDTHMADTIDALAEHIGRSGREPKIVVWAHNSHLGDASATEMGRGGEINVGQLVRERHGDNCRLVGFSTYDGTVTAASDWDAPAERKQVRPGLPESYEALFHGIGVPAFYLPLRDNSAAATLRPERLQRAIGVIYVPRTERMSHYFHASLTEQFDAMIHIDRTRAVEPLERWPAETGGETPETYPSAL